MNRLVCSLSIRTSFVVVAVPVVVAASTAAAASGCGGGGGPVDVSGAAVTLLSSCNNLTHYIQMFLHRQ